MSGVDVEKTQLIRPRRIIGPRGFHRIARIAQADEIHALDHAAIGDIKAGDQAGFQHLETLVRETGRRKGAHPLGFASPRGYLSTEDDLDV